MESSGNIMIGPSVRQLSEQKRCNLGPPLKKKCVKGILAYSQICVGHLLINMTLYIV